MKKLRLIKPWRLRVERQKIDAACICITAPANGNEYIAPMERSMVLNVRMAVAIERYAVCSMVSGAPRSNAAIFAQAVRNPRG